MGEVEGENEKLDWKWAVEPMTPSLSMKVSRLKAEAWLLANCCCMDDKALELSREYPLSSGSFSKSRLRADELGLMALTWGEKLAGRFRVLVSTIVSQTIQQN
jgi:hypothetical protein